MGSFSSLIAELTRFLRVPIHNVASRGQQPLRLVGVGKHLL